jgi:hypothetical protein
MEVASSSRKRLWFPWSTLAAACAGVVAYIASAGHAHRSITHGATTSVGIGIVLFALATPLGEISVELEQWTSTFGMIALGVTFGFFARLFTG